MASVHALGTDPVLSSTGSLVAIWPIATVSRTTAAQVLGRTIAGTRLVPTPDPNVVPEPNVVTFTLETEVLEVRTLTLLGFLTVVSTLIQTTRATAAYGPLAPVVALRVALVLPSRQEAKVRRWMAITYRNAASADGLLVAKAIPILLRTAKIPEVPAAIVANLVVDVTRTLAPIPLNVIRAVTTERLTNGLHAETSPLGASTLRASFVANVTVPKIVVISTIAVK